MNDERHLHIDLAAWAERNLVADDGRALRLQEWQRDILERVGRGERVVLFNSRRDAAALGLLRLIDAGVIVFDGGLPQAEAVYEAARDAAERMGRA